MTTNPAEQPADPPKILDRYSVLIALGALIVGVAGTSLVFYQFFNKPQTALGATVRTADLLMPDAMVDKTGLPDLASFQRNDDGPYFPPKRQQIELTITNNGKLPATDVRLIVHHGASGNLCFATERNGKLESTSETTPDIIKLKDLDIGDKLKLYFWSDRQLSPGTTWTLAHSLDSEPVTIISSNDYAFYLIVVLANLPTAAMAAVMLSFAYQAWKITRKKPQGLQGS